MKLILLILLITATMAGEIQPTQAEKDAAAEGEGWVARDDIAAHAEGDAVIQTTSTASEKGHPDSNTIELSLYRHTIQDWDNYMERFKLHMDPDNAAQLEELAKIQNLSDCLKSALKEVAYNGGNKDIITQMENATWWEKHDVQNNWNPEGGAVEKSYTGHNQWWNIRAFEKSAQVHMELGCNAHTPPNETALSWKNEVWYDGYYAYFDVWISITGWNGFVAAVKSQNDADIMAFVRHEFKLVDGNCKYETTNLDLPACNCDQSGSASEDQWCCTPAIVVSKCDQVQLDIIKYKKANRISYEFAHCFRAVQEDDFQTFKESRRWTCVNTGLEDADTVLHFEHNSGVRDTSGGETQIVQDKVNALRGEDYSNQGVTVNREA